MLILNTVLLSLILTVSPATKERATLQQGNQILDPVLLRYKYRKEPNCSGLFVTNNMMVLHSKIHYFI